MNLCGISLKKGLIICLLVGISCSSFANDKIKIEDIKNNNWSTYVKSERNPDDNFYIHFLFLESDKNQVKVELHQNTGIDTYTLKYSISEDKRFLLYFDDPRMPIYIIYHNECWLIKSPALITYSFDPLSIISNDEEQKNDGLNEVSEPDNIETMEK